MRIPFDTHAFVKKLTAAGVSEAQAEVHAQALGELVIERLATREDVQALKEDIERLGQEMERLRQDLRALEERVDARLRALEERLDARLREFVTREELRSDLKDLELRLTLRFGAMLAAAVAIIAALVKLL